MDMEEYPKLLAIGWNPMRDNDKGTLIYLLEDEHLFYGYAQNPNFEPRVKPGNVDAVALRWCRGLALPKGDEDVRKLYLEALDIIRDNNDLIDEYLYQKNMSETYGKEYWIDIEDAVKQTLAIPTLSKYLPYLPVFFRINFEFALEFI
jgi:hypothetical protein